MKEPRLKTRNGKILIMFNGMWYTEEAFEVLFPKDYAQMFQLQGVWYAWRIDEAVFAHNADGGAVYDAQRPERVYNSTITWEWYAWEREDYLSTREVIWLTPLS